MDPSVARTRRRLVVLAGALAVVAALAYVARADAYRVSVQAVEASPFAGAAAVGADVGIVVLLALAVALAVLTWRAGRARFALLMAGGLGVPLAYATSELVKVLVAQPRPCWVLDVETVLACPPAGDWSWPSNHATVAAAAAAAMVVAVPRVWPLVTAVAVTVALARVGAGVHYPHDVASGAALGVLVASATSTLARVAPVGAPRSRRDDDDAPTTTRSGAGRPGGTVR